jgi:hypothetical protein
MTRKIRQVNARSPHSAENIVEWQQRLADYARSSALERADCYSADVTSIVERKCQSPIEKLLLAEIIIILGFADQSPQKRLFRNLMPALTVDRFRELSLDAFEMDSLNTSGEGGCVSIGTQIACGRYRCDICIFAYTGPGTVAAAQGESLVVIVECDGHDFHERTKEQAARHRQPSLGQWRRPWLTASGASISTSRTGSAVRSS